MRALVTGVTRGIGRSLVDHLVAGGWEVAAVGRRETALRELAAAWGPTVRPYVADVTDRAALERVASAAGDLDLVVANAGALTAAGRFWESDVEEWWHGFEVNTRGVAVTARAVLPAMVARGSGRLVLMTSGIGNAPSPWGSQYAASKAAVTRFGESLAQELEGTGVHCFHISPGTVRTDMTLWPADLLRFRPELARIPDDDWTPVDRVQMLLDRIASGSLDALSGRFLHATDDPDRLLAAVRVAGPRARTLRLVPAEDADPVAR
ncbi:MAG: SDR family NAD(P)-dependent oxidoreductase [Actinomycetales bacterium]|nr:SDR family NAD(P)-dependent oxidoreductase [Actinomycetales bacterium]